LPVCAVEVGREQAEDPIAAGRSISENLGCGEHAASRAAGHGTERAGIQAGIQRISHRLHYVYGVSVAGIAGRAELYRSLAVEWNDGSIHRRRQGRGLYCRQILLLEE